MERRENQITRRQCLACMAAAAAATQASRFCWGANDRKLLRVAVSTETIVGANINDARAAYRVWMNEYTVQSGGQVVAETVPEVFISSEEVICDVRQGTIDFYGITGLEYAKIVDLSDPDNVVIQDYLADGIEYVLLVHNSSPFKKIADLRGAQIVSHLHRDTVLLPAWIGNLLAAANLPPAEHFFGSLSSHDKLNQILLPVFFRHVDGACVARRSWETAAELNPQLGRDLRPLAVSPKVVPILIAFHRNCNAIGRKLVIDSILRLSTVVAGQQIAALYQARSFLVRPSTAMKATVDMVREFERLPAQQAHSRKGPS
jgi:ABC-type phosphate/phosphonate transport system substrate-binding protein